MSAERHTAEVSAKPAPAVPAWSAVLRSIREARSVTQAGWAAHLGVGRRTVQRWERGEVAPDAVAEQAIVRYCAERGLFRRYEQGSLAGRTISEQWLRDLLAEARISTGAVVPPSSAPSPETRGFVQTLPSTLITPLTGLIDRSDEQEELQHLLLQGDVRLVTLTGPGGVGKTRLALHVAAELQQHMADGVTFVSLGPMADPDLVPSAIAQALSLRPRGDRPVLDVVLEFLRTRQMLLVLDNFEHVIPAAPIVAEICATGSGLTVLATSRERLHLRGERELVLHPMALPVTAESTSAHAVAASPAVQLFVERAQAVNVGFRLADDNADAVAAICHRVDGLPLAIELVAARSKMWPPRAMLGRLTNRLAWLVDGPRDLPARQRTMRDTIAWSYDLLDSAEQIMLRRLSVFAGGCSAEAAGAICNAERAPNVDVLDLIASLVDKSLVQMEGEGAETRFRMLELVREYAAERLAESGEAAGVRTAHLRFFRRLAQQAYLGLQGAEQFVWLSRLEQELDNVRAALDWSLSVPANVANGQTLAATLTLFWWQSGHLREGHDWLVRLLAADDGTPTESRTGALFAAAQLAIFGAGYRAAKPFLEECVAHARAVPVPFILPLALAMHTAVALLDGDAPEMQAAAEEALTIARRLQNPAMLAQVLFWCGRVAYLRGDLPAAEERWTEGLAVLRDLGDGLQVGGFLGRLGDLAFRRGDLVSARRHCDESVTIWGRAGDSAGIAQEYATLGRVALAEANMTEATWFFRTSLAHAREAGSRMEVPLALSGLAAAAAERGRPAYATELYGAAEALGDEVGLPFGALYPGEHDDRIAALRSALGDTAFEIAWRAGRAMSFDRALVEGLRFEDGEETAAAVVPG